MKNPHPRRKFLKSAAMTTASAGLALGAAQLVLGQRAGRITRQTGNRPGSFPVPLKAEQEAVFAFSNGTFAPYVGDIFTAPNARGEAVSMTLIRVEVYKPQRTTPIRNKAEQPHSFSVTFRAEESLPQFTSIHKVSHPALGTFDLFLTSRKADDGSLIYEAVFNNFR